MRVMRVYELQRADGFGWATVRRVHAGNVKDALRLLCKDMAALALVRHRVIECRYGVVHRWPLKVGKKDDPSSLEMDAL